MLRQFEHYPHFSSFAYRKAQRRY
ncbi:hypothetical protein ZWY2020_049312 [Hordeum vulgare]|nr:hypothetical protein ZWY2020_049312 [Hordeum vulgare]